MIDHLNMLSRESWYGKELHVNQGHTSVACHLTFVQKQNLNNQNK